MSRENNVSPNVTPHDLIPKPCHEDWQKMTGDEKRRHCAQCNTYVENLTGKSVAEILALREKKGGKLCGVFHLAPSMSKPLALGSGIASFIASLALASCKKEEPPVPVVGEVCMPPEQVEPDRKKTVEPKPAEIKHPDILLGDISLPDPQRPEKTPGKGE